VALGGAGISLVDLVRLYAALSNAGEVAPLRYRPNDAAARGTPIFGPLAAWYVNDILADAPPPPGVLPAEVRRGRRLAFKTGTSYGYRDFWAVGYDPEVTIGVWAGRPDGTPTPGGSGRLTAAPILFKIADLLGPSPARSDPPPPPGTLLVGRNDLPPRLQRLDPRPLAQPSSQTGGLKIVYPPDGALIEWRGEDVPLEVIGGKAPFRWLVDGKPLPPAPPRRPIYWQPDGIGFAQLAVIDADGRSVRSTVRLSP
jgi:penicillin-binding protein 1C